MSPNMLQLYHNLDIITPVAALTFSCISYIVVLTAYRLWFSPIAHIPGPFLARATYWYEFYYDVILTGRYVFKIRDLHEQYGPIIRINPHEIHVLDHDFLDVIYASGARKRNRWAWQAEAFGMDSITLSACDSVDHRRRRAPLNSYFSQARVRSLQPLLESKIRKTLARFEDFKLSGEPLHLDAAMYAYSSDSVMQYAFGRSYDRTAKEDFDQVFHKNSIAVLKNAHVTKHLPFVHTLIKMLPQTTLRKTIPEMASNIELQEDIKQQVINTQQDVEGQSKSSARKTIFYELLDNNVFPEAKNFSYLWQNGCALAFGGTSTTATVLYTIIFYLLEDDTVLSRLRNELRLVSTKFGDNEDSPDLTVLEGLGYLVAVVREGLRMSGTVTTRLARIDPVTSNTYTDTKKNARKTYVIPPGTPMSSTVLLLHHDPSVYPNPHQFRPDRWLREEGNTPPEEQHFLPFLKGQMNCIGINLAYAQIYLFLYHLFKPGMYGTVEVRMQGDRGCLELFETTYRDIEVVGDALGPIYRPDSNGVRILVRP